MGSDARCLKTSWRRWKDEKSTGEFSSSLPFSDGETPTREGGAAGTIVESGQVVYWYWLAYLV